MDRFFRSLGSAFFVLIEIDTLITSVAAMGSGKLKILDNLREAWNAVPDQLRRERFQILADNKTQAENVVKIAVEKGLVREERGSPASRSDWRSDATRVANSISNDQGRQLKRFNTEEEMERAEKRMRLAVLGRDAAKLQLESRSLEIQARAAQEAPGSAERSQSDAANGAQGSAASSQHPLANILHAPVLPAPSRQALAAHGAADPAQALQKRDALLQGVAKPPNLVTN